MPSSLNEHSYIFIYIYTLSIESLATLFQFYFETFSFSPKKSIIFTKKELIRSPKSSFYSKTSIDQTFYLEIRFIEIRYIEIRFIEIRFVWRISKLYDVYQWCERFESYSSRFFCHLHISKELKLSAFGATVPIYIALWECI